MSTTPRRSPRRSLHRVAAVLAAGTALVAAGQVSAVAVNADHGSGVVSADPANSTPHVMNGSVNAVVQIGNRIVAAGTFTSVSPAGTFTNTADDLVRNRIFAFDATTGAIDPTFDPNLGGAANSLDTDGTSIFVGGAFGSVGGNPAIKRLARLTPTGQPVAGFVAVPNAAVAEVVVRGPRLFVGGSFTSIKRGKVTTARGAFAELRAGDGTVRADVAVPFTGLYNGGATKIIRMDANPAGTQVAAIGNFTAVDGQPREQIALVDTPADAPATVSSWRTSGYSKARNACATVFESFMRDVDWAPDGSYLAVSTTGAFAGGSASGTLCDSVSRWEAGRTGEGQEPSWVAYTGGDTTYGIAATGAAIYVGGHMRWQNNPFQGDQAGPGAVAREGLAALDPLNGLPLTWNPGRTRGVGAQAMYATSAGLWVGSDTTQLGKERHGRIAFLPLAGGTTNPVRTAPALPGDLFAAGTAACTGGEVLYRVNAGGPQLDDAALGPAWTTDDAFRTTGNAAAWGTPPPTDSTVPPCTNPAIFADERWDEGAAPELAYSFPVPAGQTVTVRLYFADRCGCTSTPGSRVFGVALDGAVVLPALDLNAEVGHDVGTMRAFTVTSDGSVDVELLHGVENPLVSGIEVLGAGGGPVPAQAGVLRRVGLDTDGTPSGPAVTASTELDWSTLRGAFLLDGVLYSGQPDGSLARRTFDAVTGVAGPAQLVDLHDDPETGERIPFALSSLSGMFFDPATHRLWYTVSGDSRLFYRYFAPQSEVVGAQTFVGDAGGVDLSSVAGMTLAGGHVLYGSRTDGALRSVPFASGVVGVPTVVSADGSWTDRALFVPTP